MIIDSLKSTPVGFEPTRAEPIGLAGRRLNHSAKVSMYEFVFEHLQIHQFVDVGACEHAAGIYKFIQNWIPFGDHPLKLERYRED
jgi:hypothetical protein